MLSLLACLDKPSDRKNVFSIVACRALSTAKPGGASKLSLVRFFFDHEQELDGYHSVNANWGVLNAFFFLCIAKFDCRFAFV